MSEQFLATPEWPLQPVYKKQLHERIKRWGSFIVPLFENMDMQEREGKESFFQWLMESVERGDKLTAQLISTLDFGVRDEFVYGDAFDAIREERNDPEHNPGFVPRIQENFNALFAASQFRKEAKTID